MQTKGAQTCKAWSVNIRSEQREDGCTEKKKQRQKKKRAYGVTDGKGRKV